MLKLRTVLAAVALFGLSACGVDDTQTPDAAPTDTPASEVQATSSEVPIDQPGGVCESHCDGKYCFSCWRQPDGVCACFVW